MTTFLLASSGETINPSFALLVFTAYVLLSALAGIVTVAKGQWRWFLVGILTGGLAFFYAAFLPATPRSLWSRARQRRFSAPPSS